MYKENRNLRGVQKFVDTKVVSRNSIGRIMVSANSCTPYNQLKVFRRRNIISVWILFLWREEMQYLTTAEFSKKWNVSQRRVSLYCKNGRIPGAEYKGNMWLIPEDAIKPEDPRKKNKVIDNGI